MRTSILNGSVARFKRRSARWVPLVALTAEATSGCASQLGRLEPGLESSGGSPAGPTTDATDPTDDMPAAQPTIPAVDPATAPPSAPTEPANPPGTAEPDPVVESLQLVATSPSANAVGIPPNTDLELTFSEAVVGAAGTITVIQTAGAVVLEEVPIDDDRVAIDLEHVTIDLDEILLPETDYYVTVTPGAFEATGGNTFGGIADQNAFSFATAGVAFPGAIVDSLASWLDAAYPGALKMASGVRWWADRSPLHTSLRQDMASNQPMIADLNGQPAVRFDGLDDYLALPGSPLLEAFELFVVWLPSAAPPTDRETRLLALGDAFAIAHGSTVASNQRAAIITLDGTPNALQFGLPQVEPHLWSVAFDNARATLTTRTDGGAAVRLDDLPSTPLMTTGALSLGALGNGELAFQGDIAELLLYSRVLGDAEREAVEDYLTDKWRLILPQCPDFASLGPNGHCYAVSTGAASWSAGRNACREVGLDWDLTTIRSSLDNAFLATLLDVEAWAGGTFDAPAGLWTWVTDDQPFWMGAAPPGAAISGIFANWSANEPNGGGDQPNCLRLLPNGAWADLECDNARRFACEGPAD